MLGSHETPLTVARIAVRKQIRAGAKDADRASFLGPPHDPVIGDVAPQQIATVAEPDRAFAPTASFGESLDGRKRIDVAGKARIEHADGFVRIARQILLHMHSSSVS